MRLKTHLLRDRLQERVVCSKSLKASERPKHVQLLFQLHFCGSDRSYSDTDAETSKKESEEKIGDLPGKLIG